ncbi:MAG: hypothetical protein GYA34_06040 [Chloroflexi bacterium]|nr:hypothetical protein [Chloroflexota bacterium]
MSELLNFSQRNRIFNTLRGFEEDLHMANHWLSEYEEQGSLYHYYLKLSPEYFPYIQNLIAEALKIIGDLSMQLHLSKREENAARMIMGRMTMDWTYLSDCHAKDLRSSGAVHPGLAELLDSSIDRLAQIALDLGHIFGRSPMK